MKWNLSNLYFTNERVDDRVNALIVDSDGIVATYDDSAGTLTLTTDAGLAGAGLTYSSGVINVVGGDGLTASANSLDVDSTVVRTLEHKLLLVLKHLVIT